VSQPMGLLATVHSIHYVIKFFGSINHTRQLISLRRYREKERERVRFNVPPNTL